MARAVMLHPNQPIPDSLIPDYAAQRNQAVAERIAPLIGGEFREAGYETDDAYFVPEASMLRSDANRLGIDSEDDLFGGVVDLKLHRDKAVLHSLIGGSAVKNPGYSSRFSELVSDAVLPGFTAFSSDDATQAFELLTKQGYAAVRCKDPSMDGGNGQTVITDTAEWQAFIRATVAQQVFQEGIVLEPNVGQADTLSIGQIYLGGKTYSYYGHQQQTKLQGVETYGGTTLTMFRGSLADLLTRLPVGSIRTAVEQSSQVIHAYSIYEPLLSRTNFDVVQGMLPNGTLCSGVVDQSFRIGGASPAELTAIQQLEADPTILSATAQVVISWDPVNTTPEPNDTIFFDHPLRRDTARILEIN